MEEEEEEEKKESGLKPGQVIGSNYGSNSNGADSK